MTVYLFSHWWLVPLLVALPSWALLSPYAWATLHRMLLWASPTSRRAESSARWDAVSYIKTTLALKQPSEPAVTSMDQTPIKCTLGLCKCPGSCKHKAELDQEQLRRLATGL